MNEFDDGIEAINELPILVPILVEAILALFEQLEDRLRRLAALELLSGRIILQIDLHFFGVLIQSVANQLQVRGLQVRRGHFW